MDGSGEGRAGGAATPRAERPALPSLDPLDEAVELMFYAHRGVTRGADAYLARFGFAQAHHRILYILARQDGVSVTELVRALGISKQAVQRPLKQLSEIGFIAVGRDPARYRSKLLHLTKAGRDAEQGATQHKRDVLERAFNSEPDIRRAWTEVMRRIAENA